MSHSTDAEPTPGPAVQCGGLRGGWRRPRGGETPTLVSPATSAAAHDTPIDAFPRQHIFGLDFVSDGSIHALARSLFHAASEDGSSWRCVVTPNVDHLVRYERNPQEAAVARAASVVLPDGMPLVWGSRLLGRPLGSRLAGSDLFALLWPLLVEGRVPTTVLCPGAAVARGLTRSFPEAGCIVAPMLAVDDDVSMELLVDAIDEDVRARRSGALFIAVSMPKHHALAQRLQHRWREAGAPAPVVFLVGASPEFYLGLVRRAPPWMRRAGVEWIHRLLSDPRRLARRYLVDDMRFLGLMWREFRVSR